MQNMSVVHRCGERPIETHQISNLSGLLKRRHATALAHRSEAKLSAIPRRLLNFTQCRLYRPTELFASSLLTGGLYWDEFFNGSPLLCRPAFSLDCESFVKE